MKRIGYANIMVCAQRVVLEQNLKGYKSREESCTQPDGGWSQGEAEELSTGHREPLEA